MENTNWLSRVSEFRGNILLVSYGTPLGRKERRRCGDLHCPIYQICQPLRLCPLRYHQML